MYLPPSYLAVHANCRQKQWLITTSKLSALKNETDEW
jgi:hypothetical protein